MPDLETILHHKRLHLAEQKQRLPQAQVERLAQLAPPPLDFIAALRARSDRGARSDRAASRPALIAEIKRASPSKGVLAAGVQAPTLAELYRRNGAAAVSVLTEVHFFHGSLDDLRAVSALSPRLPVLRKDFILEPYQVYEARAAGADALLLIAACLDSGTLAELHRLTLSLGMAALVEVHALDELERVQVACAPTLIGINNRNLRTFEVSLATSLALLPLLPPEVCAVAESGIHSPEDAAALAAAGATAILVGEALVTATDVPAQVRRLSGPPPRPRVKFCGLTTLEDTQAAIEAGADLLGFNFYPPSPRAISAETCRSLLHALRPLLDERGVRTVGVFVNTSPTDVAHTLAHCGLDLAQLSGDEPPADLQALAGRAFKALRLPAGAGLRDDWRTFLQAGACPALLLDAAVPGQYGGTGQPADWPAAAGLARQLPLLLAGGLTPANVAAAIAAVQPWGVDVASGIESASGRKDPRLMAEFVRAVKG